MQTIFAMHRLMLICMSFGPGLLTSRLGSSVLVRKVWAHVPAAQQRPLWQGPLQAALHQWLSRALDDCAQSHFLWNNLFSFFLICYLSLPYQEVFIWELRPSPLRGGVGIHVMTDWMNKNGNTNYNDTSSSQTKTRSHPDFAIWCLNHSESQSVKWGQWRDVPTWLSWERVESTPT